MQFQSDILDCHVHRPKCIETTALGAAYLAGLAIGYWASLEDIRSNWAIDSVFRPQMDGSVREDLLEGWQLAVQCSMLWEKRKNK
jgi:glycerol kinase